jgi:hypothetical protein
MAFRSRIGVSIDVGEEGSILVIRYALESGDVSLLLGLGVTH